MSLETRLAALVAAVGADVKDLKTPYGFRWYRATTLASLGRGNAITFDARNYDYRAGTAIALPASSYTIPVSGIWHFDWRISSFIGVSSAGWWFLSVLLINNVECVRGSLEIAESSTTYQLWQSVGAGDWFCNAGDTVALMYNSASALGMPIDGGVSSNYLDGHLVAKV